MTKIIGLSGAKGSGKSTCAEVLVKYFGATRVGYAMPMKNVAVSMLGLNPEHVYGPDKLKDNLTQYKWENMPIAQNFERTFVDNPKTGLMTVREVIQVLGTEILRMMDPNIHINAFGLATKKVELVACDDTRFPNECDYILNQNPENIILRLTRTDGRKDGHLSETALNNYKHDRYYLFDNAKMDLETQQGKLIAVVSSLTNLDIKLF